MRVGVYPGSFDPPTVAHLAVADAARRDCNLDRLDLVLSTDTLGKDDSTLQPVGQRVARLEALIVGRPWLAVRITSARLIAEIAIGYEVVVMGADKWAQVVDPAWYPSPRARDDALARLPHVAVAPRPPHPVPTGVTVLSVPEWTGEVSSTAVREGRTEWAARPPHGADDTRTR